jgi:flavin-binding protein dodecin
LLGSARDASIPTERRGKVSIAKVVELTASSPTSFEDAVKNGVEKAGETLRHIQGAWVSEQKVDVEDGKVTAYRVTIRITFLVE